jgi:hypothetical protein
MADQLSKALMMGASGAQSDKLYVDDVFTTYLYDGSGSANRDVVNGMDLAGEGGLVWIKNRTSGGQHVLMDTVRGAGGKLHSDSANAEETGRTDLLSAFNNNGFSIGGSDNYTNGSGKRYVSYSFRKAEKFFDIVTWTGNDATDRTIAHNLGSVPGCIIVKCRNATKNWKVYHRKLNNGSSPEDYNIELDNTSQQNGPNAQPWNETAPTSTHFTVNGDASQVNGSGNTYVAYVFAHDAGGFGDAGDQSIIKCGTYTGNGGDLAVDIGFEPQWLLIKNYDGYSAGWQLFDNVRGIGAYDLLDRIIMPHSDSAEITSQDRITLTTTGIRTTENDSDTDANGHKFMYVAIRRPDASVGKKPTVGTDVFALATGNGTMSIPNFTTGFVVDFALQRQNADTENWYACARPLVGKLLLANTSAAETANQNVPFDSNTGWAADGGGSGYMSWNWKRYPKGFDLVTYKGNGTTGTTVKHSLGVVPEMFWIKRREHAAQWMCYHKGLNGGTNPEEYGIALDSDAAQVDTTSNWNDTAPTSTNVTLYDHGNVNENGNQYLMCLWASVGGISKIGYYDGSDSTQTITTGFQPRFVLIKRTNAAGEWLVLDTTRGWGSGNDQRIKLNDDDAQESGADVGAPTSTGFTLTGNQASWSNAGDKYIYYAQA